MIDLVPPSAGDREFVQTELSDLCMEICFLK